MKMPSNTQMELIDLKTILNIENKIWWAFFSPWCFWHN